MRRKGDCYRTFENRAISRGFLPKIHCCIILRNAEVEEEQEWSECVVTQSLNAAHLSKEEKNARLVHV